METVDWLARPRHMAIAYALMRHRPFALSLVALTAILCGCVLTPARTTAFPTRAQPAATLAEAGAFGGLPVVALPVTASPVPATATLALPAPPAPTLFVPTPEVLPSATPLPPTATSTATQPPPPTDTPTATPTPLPSPTPQLLAGVTLDGLRARTYPGGTIEILRTLETAATYTRYYIAYPSDGLRITGILQVPPGAGPFPVIILNHGYQERSTYWAGSGTWMAAEYLNGRGYLTISSDYRSWGESGWGPSLFHTGLVADVLNLISSLPSLPAADPNRVGMWGHSMGGGITTKILTIDPRVRAGVLYASNSGDDADLIARWGRGCLPGETQNTTNCNPGEVIPADLPPEMVAAYLAAAADPAMLQQIAPIYHLDRVTAPVQIHIGTADGMELNATPPEWSTKLYAAFQAAGKPAELFVYEGQGHLFYGQGWTEMISRAADFFDANVR